MSSRREMARRAAAKAFTLIELLVVILIIAVIIAITIPALGGARTAAKRSATQNLMNTINASVGQFIADERRLPGYFTERDMGSLENASTYGMSSMENVMLDLIGMPPVGAQPDPIVKIGPTAATQMDFAFDQFGVPGTGGTKQYYTPDPKYYVAQVGGTQQIQTNPTSGHARAEGDKSQLKDVVDAWGMPILAWRQDETATKPIAGRTDFVQDFSNTGTARFYWASNACFLRAPAAGKGYRQWANPTDLALPSTSAASMIGSDPGPNEGSPSVAQASQAAQKSLVAVLGNPSYPVNRPPPQAPRVPASPRGSLILQSAAQDGYFVGTKDRGRKQFSVDHLDYEFNFVTVAGGTLPANQYTDKDGKGTTVDIMSGFDDILAAGGN